MHNYQKLSVWEKAVALATTIYRLTDTFPSEEKYGLVVQMRRCAVSIPANIAEGASRSSSRDFSRFLEIALGSAFELETHIIISGNLGFLLESVRQEVFSNIKEIQMMLSGLIKRKQSNSP